MTSARLGDIDVRYEVEGEGPTTLVLISGLADDFHLFDLQMPAFLRAGLRVVRYDNRGIGATSKPAGPYTTAQFAADLKALVDHLGLEAFHLAGISMGGMIAQEYALAHGDDLASVTLACTYAAPGPFCGANVCAVGRDGAGDGGGDDHARRRPVGVHAGVLRDGRRSARRGGDRNAFPRPAGSGLPRPARVDPHPRHDCAAGSAHDARRSCSQPSGTS